MESKIDSTKEFLLFLIHSEVVLLDRYSNTFMFNFQDVGDAKKFIILKYSFLKNGEKTISLEQIENIDNISNDLLLIPTVMRIIDKNIKEMIEKRLNKTIKEEIEQEILKTMTKLKIDLNDDKDVIMMKEERKRIEEEYELEKKDLKDFLKKIKKTIGGKTLKKGKRKQSKHKQSKRN